MQRPKQIGIPIDQRRFDTWLGRFGVYQSPVTRPAIEGWLGQFNPEDQDLAARILDSVLFINSNSIQYSYRELLNSLPEWSIEENARVGRWFFVPFSGSTGESGDSMLHIFRMANSLTQRKYNSLFIHRSELTSLELTENDKVIFVDDFSGSGNQVSTSWSGLFKELIIGSPQIYLFLAAATNDAIRRINNETDLQVHCNRMFTNRDNFFHPTCRYYTQREKNKILQYCKTANNANPKGFGNRGLLLVFSHRCPNNSIPILHSNSQHWDPLFPRFLQD